LQSEKKTSSLHYTRGCCVVQEVGYYYGGCGWEALAVYILNKLHGQLQVAAVKAPGFGDNRKSILGDLAILTGGTVFTDELDIKLERATPDLLDSTGSITITKEDTIVLNGESSKDSIQARCEQIKSIVADPTTSKFDKAKLQERLAG
jgi:chaperonin GroEL